jgi:hypothetical protein
MKRTGLSLQHLLWYADEGKDMSMLNRIVTGDESWIHHYQPESRRASVQWKHRSSPRLAKKFKVTSTPSAGKVMLTVFWDSRGVLLACFQKHGEYVNSTSYCKVLLNLWDATRRRRPGQLARGILLHRDNARPHTAQATQDRIEDLQWNFLNTRIWPLVTSSVQSAKRPACWQAFRWWRRGWNGDAEVAEGFDALVKRWENYINVDGGYVEK